MAAVGAALVILFYVAIGVGVLAVAVLLYLRAAMSRRVYRCPHCGELVKVELMKASFCNVCGAPLRNAEETDD